MADETLQIEDLLQGVSLFRGLDETQIAALADRLLRVYLDAGELLFSEGDPGDSLYIIFRGQVRVTRGGGESAEELAVLGPGDYFGEEAIVTGQPRSASIVALSPVVLLRVGAQLYTQLMEMSPRIQRSLEAAAASHQLARQVAFEWLSPGENVHLIARKHVARLWLMLSGPVVVSLFSIPLFVLAVISQTATPLLLGGMVLLGTLAWGVWNVVDWGNDYYLITDQRVVWLEKVIGLYESRQEAPLSTVLSVSVATDAVGRILGYGDVVVRTYTGRIIMRHVGRPEQLASLVEQYWMRSRKKNEEAEAHEMVVAIREHLGLEVEEGEPAFSEPEATEPEIVPPIVEDEVPGIMQLIMANFFQMRYEEGSVITYRKHWFLLLTKIWQPSLGLIAVTAMVVARLLDYLLIFSLNTVLVMAIALLTVLGGWWLYQFIDWRNDIYQLTADHIVDIDRKPLGTEQTRSAPLENILSLRHERVGILGLLFNFGLVAASIGKAEFTFEGVHDPARVQQDIFMRMDERLQKKREAEAARERARMAEWLAAYHRNAEEFREEERTASSNEG